MKECPFSSRNKCYIWDDYQIASVALQEAEELCSSNWREISYLMDRVKPPVCNHYTIKCKYRPDRAHCTAF